MLTPFQMVISQKLEIKLTVLSHFSHSELPNSNHYDHMMLKENTYILKKTNFRKGYSTFIQEPLFENSLLSKVTRFCNKRFQFPFHSSIINLIEKRQKRGALN